MRISVVKHWHVLLEYILPTEEHLHPKRMCCSIPDLDSCSDIFAKIFLKPDFLLVEHTVHAPTKKKKRKRSPFQVFCVKCFGSACQEQAFQIAYILLKWQDKYQGLVFRDSVVIYLTQRHHRFDLQEDSELMFLHSNGETQRQK